MTVGADTHYMVIPDNKAQSTSCSNILIVRGSQPEKSWLKGSVAFKGKKLKTPRYRAWAWVCTQAQFKVNRNFLKQWILQSSSIGVQEKTHWAGNLSIKSPFKQLVIFIHSSLKRGSALGPTLPNVLMISMCKECWSWYWGSSRNDASCIFTRSSS